MLLGLVRPTGGRRPSSGTGRATRPSRPRIGALIEGPGFYPYLSGRDNLRVLARYRGCPTPGSTRRSTACDLADRGGDPFKSYSLGMKQRLGVAAALLGRPDPARSTSPRTGSTRRAATTCGDWSPELAT